MQSMGQDIDCFASVRRHDDGGGEQTSLFLAPPLVISEREAEQLLDALDHGLDVADEEQK